MRYKGIHTEEIQHILGKSRPSITGYINKWNKYGIDVVVDNHGGFVSTFTDEILENLKDTVLNKSPNVDYNLKCKEEVIDDIIFNEYVNQTFPISTLDHFLLYLPLLEFLQKYNHEVSKYPSLSYF